MIKSLTKNNLELYKSLKNKSLSIIIYIFIISLLGLTESFSLALLFPIAEIIQNIEILDSYSDVIMNFINIKISGKNLLLLIFFLTFLFFVLSALFNIISLYLSAKLLEGFYSHWQKKILRNYLNAEYSYHLKSMSGDLIQKLMVHTEKGVQSVSHVCQIVKEFTVIFLIYIMLIFLSYKMTIIFTFIAIFFTLIIFFFGKLKIYDVASNIAFHQEKAFAIAGEVLGNIKLIKTYSSENFFNNRFINEINLRKKYLIFNQSLINVPGIILRTLTLLVLLFVLYVVSNLAGDISKLLSMIVVFAGAGYRLNSSVGTINNAFLSLVSVLPSLKIVSNELNINPIRSENNKKELIFKDIIKFNNLNFKYDNSQNFSLKNINFSIKKGSIISLVGNSGSGKSTIIDILLGFHKINNKSCFIDKIDFNDIGIESWRKNLGYVSQESQIFSGTIFSNIIFKNSINEKERENILNAADISDIKNFIERLPFKLDTKTNEKGLNFSSGQRQRLAICRAIYANPEILIFDEATSNIDIDSEIKIFNNLKKYCKQKNITIINVSHKPTALENSDQIIFLNNGEVLHTGTHNELIDNSELYRNFYNSHKQRI